MTDHVLVPHPRDAEQAAVRAIAVRMELSAAHLQLEYRLTGELAELALPRRVPSRRADRLWEHTCFEAFITCGAGTGYYELNFSPSSEWAAFELDGYRAGLRPLELVHPPRIEVVEAAAELRVTAGVEIRALATAPWPRRVGLTAVVADRAGGRGYYALRHVRDKPDFHDAASFTASLDGSAR